MRHSRKEQLPAHGNYGGLRYHQAALFRACWVSATKRIFSGRLSMRTLPSPKPFFPSCRLGAV